MNTTIGVYDDHTQAVAALQELKANNFPVKHISILGQADVKNPHSESAETAISLTAGKEVGISLLAGSTLGVLTGVGIFAIPGLGFLFGAGALVGAIAGLDVGLIAGGIIGALSIGLQKEHYEKYDKLLKDGKFLLIVRGSKDEASRAYEILNTHGTHEGLEKHLKLE